VGETTWWICGAKGREVGVGPGRKDRGTLDACGETFLGGNGIPVRSSWEVRQPVQPGGQALKLNSASKDLWMIDRTEVLSSNFDGAAETCRQSRFHTLVPLDQVSHPESPPNFDLDHFLALPVLFRLALPLLP
jgi:hypothetical protein